jgi:16S rRNA (cytosine967-C5)-methyltransferase
MPQPTIPPARLAALAALGRIRLGEDAQFALDGQIRERKLDIRDANLASELCYGYLRHKGRLAFCLDRFLRKPGNLPPQCRTALELAGYEALFLERIPEFATRSWLTNRVRKKWGGGLAKVASAWMTWVFEQSQALLDPDFYRQDAPDERTGERICERTFLSRYHSLPLWIVDLWIDGYGLDTASRLAEAQSAPAPLGLRINPLHPRRDALVRQAEAFASELEILAPLSIACSRETARRAFPDLTEDIQNGAISRQSLEAQRILHAFGAGSWPEPVWDACAGRGGKAAYLLERGQCQVWASDPNAARLRGLVQELRRLNLPPIPVVLARADAPSPWKEHPRTILLDAPCSGLGVLARRPDSKWKRTPKDIPPLIALQDRILQQAAAILPPGGRIIYITCTLNPTENQERVDYFLDSRHDFTLTNQYATPPDSPGREFFWGAVLERTSG